MQYQLLHQEVVERCKLQWARGKTQFTASTPALAKETVKRVQHFTGGKPRAKRGDWGSAIISRNPRTTPGQRRKLLQQETALIESLRKIISMPKVYIAGVQPATLFGAEMNPVCTATVQNLHKAAYQAGPLRPIGAPAEMHRLWHPTRLLPDFKARYAAIGRHAREVWLALHLPLLTQDQLTIAGLVYLARVVRKAQESSVILGRSPCTSEL